MEHVRDAATRREVPVILGEYSPDFRSRTVSVVCRRLYHDGHSAGRIAFISDFVELFAVFALTGAAFDRPLDVVIRHALGARRQNSAAQTRVSTRIAAASFCCDGDFLR